MNHDANLQFAVSAPVFIIALAIGAVAVGMGLLGWRRRGGRLALAVESGRLILVALVLVTLCRPEWLQQRQRSERPQLVILHDRTPSMETIDVATAAGVQSRAEWVRSQLDRRFWQELDDYEVTVEGFGSNQATPGTDLHRPLADLAARFHNLRAVVLLSDGDANIGERAIGAAAALRRLRVPVLTVAVGSDQYLPDLILQDVRVPAYGLLNEHLTIPFRVRSHLSQSHTTIVSLRVDGSEVERRQVTIPAHGNADGTFLWQADRIGRYQLSLQVPPADGEPMLDNNRYAAAVQIRQELLRVLVLDTVPRWEYRFLRNALSRDPGVDVDCLLLHPGLPPGDGPDYIQALPATTEALSRYDVVFVGDIGIGPGELTREHCELLAGLVTQQGSGLVFLPGRRGREYSLLDTPLGKLMPVTLDDRRRSGLGDRRPSRWELTSMGEDHLLTRLTYGGRSGEQLWRQLPGFYWSAGVAKSRPGSAVLAVHGTRRNEWGSLPLLAVRSVGNGQVLFMGSDSAWRWRRGVEDRYHYRFWGQVVRWMAHGRHLAADDRLRLTYTPEIPETGETVFVNATVLDEQGFPLADDNVYTRIESPDGTARELRLGQTDEDWGVYQGRFVPAAGGDYQVTLYHDGSDRRLQATLSVIGAPVERVGEPARPQLLADIARVSLGTAFSTADFGRLVAALRAQPLQAQATERIRLWAKGWWALLIITCCCIFWSVRKLTGLV